ncbi:hypothetical protein HD806DRAFT_335427 [Xylariaceae sp. AK1471]|nr:hypothetical protein HD806DRAFT_335427 [Xylariaceae sp. AK1471]
MPVRARRSHSPCHDGGSFRRPRPGRRTRKPPCVSSLRLASSPHYNVTCCLYPVVSCLDTKACPYVILLGLSVPAFISISRQTLISRDQSCPQKSLSEQRNHSNCL